mmetsp:Transcript_50964/g.119542  ORF Transcript_50964/g.119542 Transcript_50964/m.119542 type:complete len:166 (-) Transcript_50964:2911-3408(-)
MAAASPLDAQRHAAWPARGWTASSAHRVRPLEAGVSSTPVRAVEGLRAFIRGLAQGMSEQVAEQSDPAGREARDRQQMDRRRRHVPIGQHGHERTGGQVVPGDQHVQCADPGTTQDQLSHHRDTPADKSPVDVDVQGLLAAAQSPGSPRVARLQPNTDVLGEFGR